MNSNAVFGYGTFPDLATAERICGQLVSEGLVTCANLLAPHRAIYRWEGELKHEDEVAAILKTSVDRQAPLTARFLALHPYDIPALAFFAVAGGPPDFLRWLGAR